ncbi:MAG TPA: DUF5666 domain-containing protein [Blastocatellia bacterium]|nr:DUF5666 domain-containing protein [Blastocatellia bacterium]
MKKGLLSFIAVMSFILALVPAAAAFDGSSSGSDDSGFRLKGNIESLPAGPRFIGDWRVAGRTVHVTSSTRIEQEEGRVAIGAFVEVKGNPQADGSVNATKIEVESPGRGEIKFKGTIESFPSSPGFIGDWQVGGRILHVTASTRIEQQNGPVAVGAFVEVEGSPREDGSLDAFKIEVKSNVAGGDGRDELKGAIESLPAGPRFIGDWRVSGRTVRVTSSTIINQEHGPVAVGALVEVHGTVRADGSLDATRIEVKINFGGGDDGVSGKGNFKGTIESLPAGLIGTWTISGKTVQVTASTRIKQEHGAVGVGVRVKVKGKRQSDGSILASLIQVKD